MVHTAQIVAGLGPGEYHQIFNRMVSGGKGKPYFHVQGCRFQGSEGITELWIYANKSQNNQKWYYIKAIINLAKLAGGGSGELLESVSVSKMSSLVDNFRQQIMELTGLPRLTDIAEWGVQRIDYAIDLTVEHPELYIKLFQRGDIVRMSARSISSDTGRSVRDENGSFRLNFYDKYSERLANDPANASKWKNILRIEIQVKGQTHRCGDKLKTEGGVYAIKRGSKAQDKTLFTLLGDKRVLRFVRKKMIHYFYYKSCCVGKKSNPQCADYWKLSEIKKKIIPNEKNKALLKTLYDISKCKSVSHYNGDRAVIRKTKENLAKFGVNIITIPAREKVGHLENIFDKFLEKANIYLK